MAAEDGLKAQKLLAQGIALGNVGKKQSRPERAKALKLKAFALSGRIDCDLRHTLFFLYHYNKVFDRIRDSVSGVICR